MNEDLVEDVLADDRTDGSESLVYRGIRALSLLISGLLVFVIFASASSLLISLPFLKLYPDFLSVFHPSSARWGILVGAAGMLWVIYLRATIRAVADRAASVSRRWLL